jgi:hypothetical protein
VTKPITSDKAIRFGYLILKLDRLNYQMGIIFAVEHKISRAILVSSPRRMLL